MEKGRNTQILNFFHQRVKRWIVGIEGLYPRVEFRPRQPQIFYSTFDFSNGSFPFVWINNSKTYKLLRKTLVYFSYVVVTQWRQSCGCFSIPGEQYANHIKFHIVCCYLLDILQFNLGMEISLSSLSIRTKSYLHELCRG